MLHKTEFESETNEGFTSETKYFDLKDLKQKPNPKPIQNLEKNNIIIKKLSISTVRLIIV